MATEFCSPNDSFLRRRKKIGIQNSEFRSQEPGVGSSGKRRKERGRMSTTCAVIGNSNRKCATREYATGWLARISCSENCGGTFSGKVKREARRRQGEAPSEPGLPASPRLRREPAQSNRSVNQVLRGLGDFGRKMRNARIRPWLAAQK
jgi:hypothetical protein